MYNLIYVYEMADGSAPLQHGSVRMAEQTVVPPLLLSVVRIRAFWRGSVR